MERFRRRASRHGDDLPSPNTGRLGNGETETVRRRLWRGEVAQAARTTSNVPPTPQAEIAELIGSKVKYQGHDVIIAGEVKIGATVLTPRDRQSISHYSLVRGALWLESLLSR